MVKIMNKNSSCGIDFGTTNTLASLASDHNVKLIALENQHVTIPSALFFDFDQRVYFGRKAIKMYMEGQNGRCMRSLKRVLGSDLMSSGTNVNEKNISFIDILCCFLRYIKQKTDEASHADVDQVVLGRPVHFRIDDLKGDQQAENELRMIAQKVGFKNVEFQFEPIAAAFAHETKIHNEKLACVIDIGGGTSDFSIIKVGQGLIAKADRQDDILASTGVRVGGNDFDKDLSLKSFMPAFGYQTQQNSQTNCHKIIDIPTLPFRTMAEWSQINSMYNYNELKNVQKMLSFAFEKEKLSRFVELIEKETGYTLLHVVEKSKIKLAKEKEFDVSLDFVSDCPIIKVNRQDFEDSLVWDIRRIVEQIDECVKQAQIKPQDIELIILTGGSTEIPYIQKLISNIFPKAEISQENKLSSVSLGLGYDSLRKFS